MPRRTRRPAESAEPPATLSSREAAAFLDVKVPTLYAYVSRGLLRSVPGPRGRARRYRRRDLERLRARRGGGGAGALRSPLSWGDPLFESAVTRLAPEGPAYRGHPLERLVREGVSFEAVAELLWSGRGAAETDPPAAGGGAGWEPAAPGADPQALARFLAPGSTPLAALQLLVPALAAADPGRFDVRPEAALPRARALVRQLAAGLALPAEPARMRDALAAPTVADAAAVALGARGPRARDALERALVVCADHEINASTFAARVVASTRADLYAVVGAALAALSGPLHGSVSEQVEALLDEVGAPERAGPVLHERLRRGERIPGFGHPFYRDGDPRARLLLEAAATLGARTRAARALEALFEAAAADRRPPPNLDAGLVAITARLGLPRGSAAGLFAVGRCAGWVAHALEQLETGGILRPRARWAGDEAPGPGDAGAGAGRGMLA